MKLKFVKILFYIYQQMSIFGTQIKIGQKCIIPIDNEAHVYFFLKRIKPKIKGKMLSAYVFLCEHAWK